MSRLRANQIVNRDANGPIEATEGLKISATKQLQFFDADGSNFIGLQPASVVATSYTLTLPDNDGNSGQILSTNGTGVLSWIDSLSDGDKGDITVSGSTWTIDPNAVTLSKIQQIATATVLGRTTAGTGNVESLSTTGTSSVVLSNTPTLVTPVLGAATGTSLSLTGGSVSARAAATQDGVVIAGRAGGTGSFTVTILPTTLSASRTLTLANGNTILSTGTTAVIGTAQTFTAAQTFRAANSVRAEAAATQDAVVLAGRAGGTGSFAITLTPATLASSTTLTLPNVTGTVALTSQIPTVDVTAAGNNAFTGANTFINTTGQTIRSAATQDGIILAGRAGGTGSFAVTLTPTTLSASRTVTLADGNTTLQAGTMATTGGTLAQFAATTSLELLGVISDETGTGALVFATSPTLTTPNLGVATATSINKVTITAPATGSTLTIADGKTLSVSNTLTFTGTDASSVAFGAGGTVAYTANKLSVFAATTSSELAGVISDETGTGSLVFANTPSLVTPVLGAATATSINKVAITAPATGSTLTIADGKTLSVSNTLTFTGTDASSVAFNSGGTVAYTANKLSVFAATTSLELLGVISDETGTGALVFANTPSLVTPVLGAATGTSLALTGGSVSTRAAATQDGIIVSGRAGGTGSFTVTISPTTLSASRTLTLPNVTGTVVTTGDTATVTNTILSTVPTATFKGRTTAGTGAPEDLTATQATALLDAFTSTLKGLAPASGGGTTNFLRADGTWAAPPGGGGGGGDVSLAANNIFTGANTFNNTTVFNADARITGTNKARFGGTSSVSNFYIQYNSTTSSLDFVAE